MMTSTALPRAAIAICALLFVASQGCAPVTPDGAANGPAPASGDTLHVRFLVPAPAAEDVRGLVRPVRCDAPLVETPAADRQPIQPGGGRVTVRSGNRILAELEVGSHAAPHALSYSVTADTSAHNELVYEIVAEAARAGAGQAPNSFTFHVHYPQTCAGRFAPGRDIWLVRLSDRTAIPSVTHDRPNRIVSFRMDRLSRFVVSH